MPTIFGWCQTLSYAIVILALASNASVRAQAQSAQETTQSKTDEASSTSPADMAIAEENDKRQLAVIQAQLTSWKVMVSNLTLIEGQLTGAAGPTKVDFDKLADLVKAKNLTGAKNQLSTIAQTFAPLNVKLQYVGFSPTSQLDPDVALTVNEWDQKLSQALSPLNREISNTFALVFSSALKTEEINVDELRGNFSSDVFAKYKGDALTLVDADLKLATQTKDRLGQEQSRLQAQADDIARKLAKGKLEINQLAIELGLPLFCGTVLLMLSIPIVIQSFSRAAGSAEQVRAIFSSGILVEIITVLLLTMSILILGLANRIEGPVLGTLLGGISGYVLNRFRGKNQGTNDDVDSTPPVINLPSDKAATGKAAADKTTADKAAADKAAADKDPPDVP